MAESSGTTNYGDDPMRPRFSIARLVTAIVLFGVGLAALRYPTNLWASGLFTATLLGLGLDANTGILLIVVASIVISQSTANR